MEKIPSDILMEISEYLGPYNAVSFKSTCKRILASSSNWPINEHIQLFKTCQHASLYKIIQKESTGRKTRCRIYLASKFGYDDILRSLLNSPKFDFEYDEFDLISDIEKGLVESNSIHIARVMIEFLSKTTVDEGLVEIIMTQLIYVIQSRDILMEFSRIELLKKFRKDIYAHLGDLDMWMKCIGFGPDSPDAGECVSILIQKSFEDEDQSEEFGASALGFAKSGNLKSISTLYNICPGIFYDLRQYQLDRATGAKPLIHASILSSLLKMERYETFEFFIKTISKDIKRDIDQIFESTLSESSMEYLVNKYEVSYGRMKHWISFKLKRKFIGNKSTDILQKIYKVFELSRNGKCNCKAFQIEMKKSIHGKHHRKLSDFMDKVKCSNIVQKNISHFTT